MLNKVFSNRYRVVEKLGIGGMAEVYKATDEVLGRTVAIKVMLPQYAADSTFAARFKQEAQSAANLQSPYIVNIYDWGYESADNIYFIAMEYVRGTDLKTAIQQRGAINQRKAAEIGSQVCAALSVAHGYDIIHRDIKPHNIMVQPDGNAKVMDFGIARASGSSMTQTGSVLGTAYYVSPEQAQGKQLTPATDLYSLGVVLYEATTGKVPFDAPDAVSVALKQVNELPAPPSTINPDIDPELEAIILRAMEKNPLNRYTTAEQMRSALNNYLAGRPIDEGIEQSADETRVMGTASSLPVITADGAKPFVQTAVMPSIAGTQKALNIHSTSKARDEEQKRRRKNTTIIGIIIGVVLLIAAGIIIYAVVSGGSTKVEVPYVINMTEAEAKEELDGVGLKAEVKLESSETVESGRVISSSPSARVKVNKGTTVTLMVSTGPGDPKEVKVPDLRNMTAGEAVKALEDVGLKGMRGDDRFDDEIAKDKVCAQDTEADSTVKEGTTITFYLSKGKETGQIPNVVGADWATAEDSLIGLGFVVEYADSEYSNDFKEGIVMRQSPSASTAEKGTVVTLTVSLGPEPIVIPSEVIGMTYSEAYAYLTQRYNKLIVIEMTEVVSQTSQLGRVVRVEPEEGSSVAPDSVVTLYVGVAPPTP